MVEKEAKNKSNKGVILLIILLILIILALVGYIFYDKGIIFKKAMSTKQTEEKIEETEKSLKDQNIIKQVSNKIDILLGNISSETDFKQSYNYLAHDFRYSLLKKKLTKEEKQKIVLDSIQWQNITDDNWKNIARIKEMVEADKQYTTEELAIKAHKQASADIVNSKSIELFGEKIENPITQIGENCLIYIYDENTKTYYKPEPRCGGTSAGYVNSYKSKFTTKNDNIYVYVSYAFEKFEDASTSNYEDDYRQIYRDFSDIKDMTITYNENDKTQYTINAYNGETFNLDASNYKEFSEYKYTFKKDSNDNYYFVSVKQTK